MSTVLSVKVLSPDAREFKLSNTEDLFTAADYFLLSTLILVFHFVVVFHVNSPLIFLVVPPAVLVVARVIYCRNRVQEESLVVVRELGVQLQTKYYNGAVSHRFVDKKRIEAIVINEAVKSYRVIFYMAFMLSAADPAPAAAPHPPPAAAVPALSGAAGGKATAAAAATTAAAAPKRQHQPQGRGAHTDDRLVLAFENLLPKLQTLLPVYRASRAMLFGEPED